VAGQTANDLSRCDVIWMGIGLTPEQYREKWKLPSDYPMVAPNYAAQRSALARKIGLGRGRVKTQRNSVNDQAEQDFFAIFSTLNALRPRKSERNRLV